MQRKPTDVFIDGCESWRLASCLSSDRAKGRFTSLL